MLNKPKLVKISFEYSNGVTSYIDTPEDVDKWYERMSLAVQYKKITCKDLNWKNIIKQKSTEEAEIS